MTPPEEHLIDGLTGLAHRADWSYSGEIRRSR